ncbi:RFC3 [Auxenochlorella protothecoides x Auxenochlorella symbiontica]
MGRLPGTSSRARRRMKPAPTRPAPAAGVRLLPLRRACLAASLAGPHERARHAQVIEPVRSRCLCVRVHAPTHPQIEARLRAVAAAEGWTLPAQLAARIAQASDRNLRRALLALEACKAQHFPFQEGQAVAAADWELYIQEIAAEIRAEQSPKRLYTVRGKVYELLVNCIPPEIIMRRLALELMQKLDDELRQSVAEQAAFFEHRLQEGSKAIFHIEAFVARFMADYKNFLLAAMA